MEQVLVLCIILLLIYLNLTKFDTIIGAIMLLLGLFILYCRFDDGFYNLFSSNLLVLARYIFAYTLFLALVLVMIKKVSKPSNNFFLLLALYIPFGIIQQLFFQYIFTDSVFRLTSNLLLSVFLGSFYYMLFHIKPDMRLAAFTFLVGLGWSYYYLMYHNILLIGISHGILGTLYYSFMVEGDAIGRRLNFYNHIRKKRVGGEI